MYLLYEHFPLNSWIFRLFYRRLHHLIEVYTKDIDIYDWKDDICRDVLRNFLKSDLFYFLTNEIMFDLYCSFKQNDVFPKSRDRIEEKILLLFKKYSSYIANSVYKFEKNLAKLLKASKQKKIEILKAMRIPELSEPINITHDIRFAVIKRANRQCESCGISVEQHPIDVYQIQDSEKDSSILLVALCDTCKEDSKNKLIPDEYEF